MVSLVDELLLLAYDDTSGRDRTTFLELGLGGAILLELTMAERVDIVDGKVRVVDASPTDDKLLNEVLRRIHEDKPRRPQTVVQRVSKGMKQTVLDDLVARRVLRLKSDSILGIFPFRRYLPANQAVEADARSRLRTAVDAGRAFDARTAALASLVYALKMERAVFPDRKQRETRRVLKDISEGSWVGDATRKAVEAAQAAVMAAVTAAAAAGAAGGS